MNIAIGLVILIIIIILYSYILHNDRLLYNNFINGFWKSDDKFCKDADIDDMILYLNTNTDDGYLIISKDNEIIENSKFNIKKKTTSNINNLIPFNNTLGNQMLEYQVDFISDDEDFTWNDGKYILNISIINSLILIYKNDVLYAKLYKENILSNNFIEYALLEDE